MLSTRVLIIVALACFVSADKRLDKDDMKALKTSWRKVKDNPVEVAKQIYLTILDKLPDTSSSYFKMLIEPMMPSLTKLVHRFEFKDNVKRVVKEIDLIIFKDLEKTVIKLEKMKGMLRSINMKKYAEELEITEAATLEVFSHFMKDNELKAWKKLFNLLEDY